MSDLRPNSLRPSVERVFKLRDRFATIGRINGVLSGMNSEEWAERSDALSSEMIGVSPEAMRSRGYVESRVFSFGYAVGVMPALFGGGFLCCGCDRFGHDVVYQYERIEDAIRAMHRMIDVLVRPPMCREPDGWVRCVPREGPNRYRVNGDPKTEYMKNESEVHDVNT